MYMYRYIFIRVLFFRYDPAVVREGAKPDMAPLHYSIIRENDALTLKLIQYGANVKQKDRLENHISFSLTQDFKMQEKFLFMDREKFN